MSGEKHCLIVEGGGFRTGFTTGVLDAFQASKFRPFNFFMGISGGSIATSYFLSRQYRSCIAAMRLLLKNEEFTKLSRAFAEVGYMNIEYLKEVASKMVPFDVLEASMASSKAEVYFVTTSRESGLPQYLSPTKENWLDILIASSTLPFVTKGKHMINDIAYFDGGWGDPLPVKWAYEQGARKIVLVRTHPLRRKITRALSDYLASLYYKHIPHLRDAFANYHLRYNQALEFIANPPADLLIEQIAPEKELKSTTLTYSRKSLMRDYRYGVDVGLLYVLGKS